jgi:hypothetical protein
MTGALIKKEARVSGVTVEEGKFRYSEIGEV